jgi:hypothetical protein
MKRLLIIVFILCLAGAGFAYYQAENTKFVGNYVGLMKIPGAGWTAARIHIEKEQQEFVVTGKAGRYRLLPPPKPSKTAFGKHAPLKYAKPVRQGPPVYTWVEDMGGSYRGQLVGRDLILDSSIGLVLTAGNVTGTLTMPDGSVFREDTEENYQALKKQLADDLRAREPNCIIQE